MGVRRSQLLPSSHCVLNINSSAIRDSRHLSTWWEHKISMYEWKQSMCHRKVNLSILSTWNTYLQKIWCFDTAWTWTQLLWSDGMSCAGWGGWQCSTDVLAYCKMKSLLSTINTQQWLLCSWYITYQTDSINLLMDPLLQGKVTPKSTSSYAVDIYQIRDQ